MTVEIKSILRPTGPVKPRLTGWKALLTHRWLRRAVQLAVLLFLVFLAV